MSSSTVKFTVFFSLLFAAVLFFWNSWTEATPLVTTGSFPSSNVLNDTMTVRANRFTPEVLLSAPRRSSGTPNAAGTLALYSQSSYSFASHSKTSEIHLLDIKTGQSSLVTRDSSASEPRWLGDGNLLVWLKSNENGNTSVIIGDADEVEKTYTAGTVPGPISNLKLCVLEAEKIGIAVSGQANTEGSLHNPKEGQKSYSSAKIYHSLFVRHWDEYVGKTRSVIFYGILAKSAPHVTERNGRYNLLGLTNTMKGTQLESPVPNFGGTDHFDISKEWIVFVSKDPHLNPATHTSCLVYAISIPSSTTSSVDFSSPPKVLAVQNLHGAATSPVISPNGKSLAFLQMEKDGYESDKNRVIIFPNFAGSELAVELFGNEGGKGSWDRSPQSILWSNDGKSLYVQAEDVGRGALFRIELNDSLNAASDSPAKLTSSGYVSGVSSLAANSSKIFLSATSLIENSLFAILDPASPSEITKVSSSSHDGATFGLSASQVEELWWKGAEDPVHAWMIKPSFFNPNKKYPLAYLVHGGPQGAWGDQWSTRWNPAVFAEQGYVVVAPNPTGSTGYGQNFTDAIRLEWGGKPYLDLVKGFEYIEKNLDYVDTSRAVALGASYGGYMMNWIQGHDFGRKFKALVTHDGVFSMATQLASDEQYFPTHDLGGPYWKNPDIWERWDPVRFTQNWATPHLIIHNELDYRLTIAEGLGAFNVLQMRGVESAFLTFPDENHWVLNQENSLVWHRCVINWINRYVDLPPILDSEGGDGLPASRGWKTPREAIEQLSLE